MDLEKVSLRFSLGSILDYVRFSSSYERVQLGLC